MGELGGDVIKRIHRIIVSFIKVFGIVESTL